MTLRLVSVLTLVAVALLACDRAENPPPEAEAPSAQRVAVAEGQGERADALGAFGDDLADAVELAPGVFQARGVGNAHLIYTPAGSVVFDTGLQTEAAAHREKLLRAAPGPVVALVASHAHADHYSGSGEWIGDDVEVIAHAEFPETQRYLTELVPFLMARNRIFYPDDVPDFPFGLGDRLIKRFYPQLKPTRLVSDRYAFALGGVSFEVLSTPGAEGADSVSLWLPDQKILFTGDFYGPIFPMWPNLDTPRGEKMRYAKAYIDSLDRVLALEPEMLVPSHFAPVVGKEIVRQGLQRMRDGVAYVHDATISGMNDGKDLHTLMREIQLPEDLALNQGHGKVAWGVRAIWESYAGWWRDESITELYPVAARAVYGDLAELAGSDAIVERADAHLAAGRPVEAIHLAEVVLEREPAHPGALSLTKRALDSLLEQSGGVNHHEVILLERELARVEAALAEG